MANTLDERALYEHNGAGRERGRVGSLRAGSEDGQCNRGC